MGNRVQGRGKPGRARSRPNRHVPSAVPPAHPTAPAACLPVRIAAAGTPDPGDRWDRVDWSLSPRQIAAALQVSRQRVYQVMAARGVPRQSRGTRRAVLLSLDTRALTLAEAAARAGCSVPYAHRVLRAAGKQYQSDRRHAAPERRFAAWAAWLRARYGYAPTTLQNLQTRCRRVERTHTLRLDRVLRQSGGLARVSRHLEGDAIGLRGQQRSALYNNRLAVRRYAEFLGDTRASKARYEPGGPGPRKAST